MATIVVRDVPDEVHQRLKRLAAAQHRSVNSQILTLLERATAGMEVLDQASPAEQAGLRDWLKGTPDE